jgi:2-phospho-L-lactate guanylyltransferase
VLVPMRALPSAKSRLAVAVPPELHGDLVTAIRADTLAAVRAAAAVAHVVVIGDADGPGVTLVQATPGLNGALRDGAAYAQARWPRDGVAALVGDLPALRPAELSAALTFAAASARGFVADAGGTGTTLLTAAPGVALVPEFGFGSAARHRVSAEPIDAGPGLRHDVDTVEDLAAAARVGLGTETAALLGVDGVIPRLP